MHLLRILLSAVVASALSLKTPNEFKMKKFHSFLYLKKNKINRTAQNKTNQHNNNNDNLLKEEKKL